MSESKETIGLSQSPSLSANALALFDAAAEAQALPGKARWLLQLAAHAATLAADAAAERGDRVGRDIVLAAPLEGLSAAQQSIVACAVALQREKLRPRRESSFVWLRNRDQRTALALAAILRLARALDGAPARLLAAPGDEPPTLVVGNAAAAEEAAAAWREALGPLAVRAPAADEADLLVPAAEPEPLPAQAQLQPLATDLGGEPIAELARRTLRRFFDKMLAREEAVSKDEDIEDVHQMRVATRRLRAALQTVEGVFEPDIIRRYRKGLRRIAQSLGAVRDGDVFLEHLHTHRDTLPEDERPALDTLIATVTTERANARRALLDDLASKRYRAFKREFGEFLSTPGAGALPPPEPGVTQRVRDFAGSAIWRRYELWRAYETILPNGDDATLHQARIAGKRFRYTLEFFAEVLGERVDTVLDPLIALQECLGDLQDGVTAREHMAALGLADDAGAQAYLATRTTERAPKLAELPRLWDRVDSGTYRRRLFELIVKM